MALQNKQLSVALLFQNIEEVKFFSTQLRSMGIIPFFYEDLKSFLKGLEDSSPDLAFVDIRMMSDGNLTLKDHPSIQSNQISLIFYANEKASPLLISTFNISHIGIIQSGMFVAEQFRAVMNRFFEFKSIKDKLFHTQEEAKIKENELLALLKNREVNDQRAGYRQFMSTLTKDVDNLKNKVDFFKAVEVFFERIQEIDEFSYLELSFNRQKLISPLSSSAKFRMIPNLWLGSQSQQGIEPFAQNMAAQIVTEAMGGDIVSLMVKGNDAHPDKLIFIKTRVEAFFQEFDWNLFEEFLNGIYANYLLRANKEKSSDNRQIRSFEALQMFDNGIFASSGVLNNSELVLIDFSSLFETIKKRKSMRFYFEKFFSDFTSKLEVQTRIDFQLVEISIKHWILIVNSDRFEDFYNDVKDYTQKFQYWKYFEDAEPFLALDIKPRIRQVPMSSLAIMQLLDEKELTAEERIYQERLAKQRTHELIWGRENIREI